MITESAAEPPQQAAAAKPLRVLFADDSENDVFLLLRALKKGGYQPDHRRVFNAADMQAALKNQAWDIVISDYEMPGFGGIEALQVLKESGLDLPFILVSAVLSEETAVAAMKAGAGDFVMKGRLARLVPAIERELRDAETRVARKTAETALRQSEEQLHQSQKLEAVGRLAAGVAHDFNNILTAITGHGEMLMRAMDVDDPRQKHVAQIEKAAQMAAALTRQLLTFSRKQVIEPRVLNLNDVVTNIQKMLGRIVGEDVELQIEIDPDAGSIKADPNQIEQIIMNLAVNARDAMPGHGKLLITTGNAFVEADRPAILPEMKPGQYVRLTVSDTGTGMSDEVKAHLFEPFFTTKAPGKGTGLGLATCFGIVKQNHGHIDVQSELGKGTSFTIYLPLVEGVIEVQPAQVKLADAAGGSETLLVVEDEPSVREVAVLALRDKGYTVFEAADGQEGLRMARQQNGEIDLILTDVVMPMMGGKEMTDAIHLDYPQTKVLFTSGYTEDAISHRGVLCPGIVFLQKPYMTATLIRKVREVLDISTAQHQPAGN